MHIIHKTTKFPFWVRTTFEHIGNAPEQAQVGQAGNQYFFYNPACASCADNTPVTAPTSAVSRGMHGAWLISKKIEESTKEKQ